MSYDTCFFWGVKVPKERKKRKGTDIFAKKSANISIDDQLLRNLRQLNFGRRLFGDQSDADAVSTDR